MLFLVTSVLLVSVESSSLLQEVKVTAIRAINAHTVLFRAILFILLSLTGYDKF